MSMMIRAEGRFHSMHFTSAWGKLRYVSVDNIVPVGYIMRLNHMKITSNIILIAERQGRYALEYQV